MVSDIDLNWCMGFIEGEGSFVIQIHEKKSKFGKRVIQLHCIASVSSVEKDKEAIYFLQKTFGGTIIFKPKEHWIKRGILNAQNQLNWRLSSVCDTVTFCEMLNGYKFKTTKGLNFEKWKEAVYLINDKKHLEKEGLIKILKLRDEMGDLPRNVNYKSITYFLPIVNEMETRGLFSEKEIMTRIILGNVVQEKQKAKWVEINKKGYSFGMDTRRNDYGKTSLD